MKYMECNAIGDAGEHFFAFTVATVLQWPCRLLDIDIGIDAQVEILDENKRSTGQFLAVQIKTTTDSKLNSKHIPIEHIQYWKTVESPVLVALVDIKKREVYLNHISKNSSVAPVKPGGKTFKVEFDKTEDLLSIQMAPLLRELAFKDEIERIKRTLLEIQEECDVILRQTNLKSNNDMVEDHEHYLVLMRGFQELENKLHTSKVHVERISKFNGNCNYETVCDKFFTARRSLISFLYRWNFHHHDSQEIDSFKNRNIEYLKLST